MSRLSVFFVLILFRGASGSEGGSGEAARPIWNLAWITGTQTPACEWIPVQKFEPPAEAVAVEVAALSRVCEKGVCTTIASPLVKTRIP